MNQFLGYLILVCVIFVVLIFIVYVGRIFYFEGVHWLNEYRLNKQLQDRLSPKTLERIKNDVQRNQQKY